MLNRILQSLNFVPTATSPSRTTYKSPWNVDEKTPSFFVFQNRDGEWRNFKDFSSGLGGNEYKFLMEYFQIDFIEATKKMASILGEEPQSYNRPMQVQKNPISFFKKEKSYKIIKTQQLQNQALVEYLKNERGLRSISLQRYLGEVYYEINEKRYFAISFITDSGGREVRNKYFKGSFGKKDIATIYPNPKNKTVKIFEGFMDFLSYLEISRSTPLSNYLILNSVSLKEKGLESIQHKFQTFELYLDNDKAGNETTQFFMNHLENCIDKRTYYSSCKDINEYLLNQ